MNEITGNIRIVWETSTNGNAVVSLRCNRFISNELFMKWCKDRVTTWSKHWDVAVTQRGNFSRLVDASACVVVEIQKPHVELTLDELMGIGVEIKDW